MPEFDPYDLAINTVGAILAEDAVPVGARGALYAAHDALAASGEHEGAAEWGRASVALLRLETATRKADSAGVADARALLAELHAAWTSEAPDHDIGVGAEENREGFAFPAAA